MQEEKRHYKIEVGDIITISKNVVNGFTFYKTYLPKKKSDGTFESYAKNITFKKGVDIEDGTKIIVKDFYEDCFKSNNNPYFINWTIRITNFEISNEDINETIKAYNEKTGNQIDFVGVSDEVLEEELPF